ncbi:MAG TPA: glycosyltransferase, partial [Thermohalobaculum sp.]|nr:glycosyltransferase [Thermohalobaculum sp.]
SLGMVYLLDEMLRVFGRLRSARPGARFLFIGHHSASDLVARARALGIEVAEDEILVQPAEHGEVPGWLAAADLAIGLIKPSFSSLGVSLTKLGEYLACGLPVIVNRGIGDVGEIVERIDGGVVLSAMSDTEMDRAVASLDGLLAIDPAGLRARSRLIHDMPVALAKYNEVYDSMAAAGPGRAM